MAKEKIYTIKVQYVFECERVIAAESMLQAKRLCLSECSLSRPNASSSLNDETIIDWDCMLHPDSRKIVKTQVGLTSTFK